MSFPNAFKQLKWFHWVGLSVAIACGTVLVVTGHVSPSQLGAWLAGVAGGLTP